MYFNIRLLKLINYLNENPTSFGDKLESTSGENIRLITKNDKANPGLNILSEILNKYPQVNPRWLLNGEGDMLVQEADNKAGYPDNDIQNHVNEPCPNCAAMQAEINRLNNKLIESKEETISALKGDKKEVKSKNSA